MTTFVIYQVFVFASLALFVGLDADTSVGEFNELKDDVFGQGFKRFYQYSLEEKIDKMIKLIEEGKIPTEVQGNQTLEYLKSMTNDCNKRQCNLDEDLERIKRLGERNTGAPNLESYLQACQIKIRHRCRFDFYERANAKLVSSVDEQSMKAVEALALQSYEDVRYRRYGIFEYRFNPHSPNHITVLVALANLDPAGSKAVLKKWTKREAALAKFMDKIRLSCVKFIEGVDPNVRLFEARYWEQAKGPWKLDNWHYSLKRCERVVDNWDMILKDANKSYRVFLADPKTNV